MSASVPISGLTALATAPAASDYVVVLDVSDTTQAATGTTKKQLVSLLFTSVTVTTSLTVTGTASISSTLSVTGATTLTGALTTLSSVSITGTGNVSPVFNTTTGATSDFIQLLFARGGANKWRLGTNIDGTNVDAFQIRNEALGAVVLSLANATGAATFSSTIASGAITSTGAVTGTNLVAGAGNFVEWASSSTISAPSNGVILLANFAVSDFSRLQLGGTTSSFPAIKRSAAAIEFRLADDSAPASLAGTVGVTGTLGYATGAGGTVAQSTDRSTAVTLNKICGTITTRGDSLNSGTSVNFLVNNSTIAATDTVVLSFQSSGATTNFIYHAVTAVAAGSFRILYQQVSGGAVTDQYLINFVVLKSVTS